MGKREGRKMEITRTQFQGVCNIIRFNWHFYLIAGILMIGLLFFKNQFSHFLEFWLLVGIGLGFLVTLVSLLVSYYVYDCSNLYELDWLENSNDLTLLNINAGFDETSQLIKNKFPTTNLTICDFYDPKKHTEISIRRARKAYPPQLGTFPVKTDSLPFSAAQFDKTIAILSAHEIRDEVERNLFFQELKRVTKPTGNIFVLEHLRDANNFLAYTIGFLHFHSKKTWMDTFSNAGLMIEKEKKITPFITLFILKADGSTS